MKRAELQKLVDKQKIANAKLREQTKQSLKEDAARRTRTKRAEDEMKREMHNIETALGVTPDDIARNYFPQYIENDDGTKTYRLMFEYYNYFYHTIQPWEKPTYGSLAFFAEEYAQFLIEALRIEKLSDETRKKRP